MERKIEGKFYETTREAEEAKLERIRKITIQKLAGIKQQAADLQDELHTLREVYDSEDKEGLAQWFNTDARFNEVRRDLLRAERATKKPYFGRIDIEDSENAKRETFYVGKTVVAENPSEPEVIDWRAPIASVYYDHRLGECQYKVPGEGIYKIDLKRKRTYEIEENNLIDYYDSDVVANDDLLTKYLSKSKRNVLSEIIATIQQEQNNVIRKNPRHNVLIQGSAGSGKTTVAMHRISYILYNYETEFKPDGFYIVGSNKVLLNYITGVLPDLDVYGVEQMTMEELFTKLLYEDWDKKHHKVRSFDKKDDGVATKSTGEWFEALRKYCARTEWSFIPREDVKIEKNGHVILKKSEVEKLINDYPDWSMAAKLERLNDFLNSNLETELFGKYYSYNVEEQKKLKKYYSNYFTKLVWKDSVFNLYKEFVDMMRGKGYVVSYSENDPDLYDLAGLAYIYKRIKETEVIQEASHVVIDEAQDFGIMAYKSLKYCLSKCTFTIMGDVSQNINLKIGLGDWEELKQIMLPDKYDYFGLLRKSYRNTVEVSNFATDILKHGTFPIYPVEPIVRHGDNVKTQICDDDRSLNNAIITTVDSYREKGYETIAIICKDETECKKAYKELKKKTDVKIFSEADSEFGNGAFVLPIEYSKGLEFDAVIIYDASCENYPKEDGYAKLLYVAATRALQELTVFYKGKLTGLIADEIPEDRRNISFIEDDFHETPFEFEEEFKTKEEIAKALSLEGDAELKLREKYGPARIVVNTKPAETKPVLAKPEDSKEKKTDHKMTFAEAAAKYVEENKPVEKKSYSLPKVSKYYQPWTPPERVHRKRPDDETEYGRMPEGTSLQPVGHGRIDNAVRWVKADRQKVDITGGYGTLRIIPVSAETVRVLFAKTEFSDVKPLPGEVTNVSVKWNILESREAVDVCLDKLKVHVDKRTGAVAFFSKNGNELLKENNMVARQYHGMQDIWWEYFEFGRKEGLQIRGLADDDWSEFASSAKYISHGPASQRAALIMSNKGYQLLIPAGIKALLCTIPAYGPYISFEKSNQIDYIFRSAR